MDHFQLFSRFVMMVSQSGRLQCYSLADDATVGDARACVAVVGRARQLVSSPRYVIGPLARSLVVPFAVGANSAHHG